MIDAQINELSGAGDNSHLIAGDEAEELGSNRQSSGINGDLRGDSVPGCPVASKGQTLTNETVADNAVVVLAAG